MLTKKLAFLAAVLCLAVPGVTDAQNASLYNRNPYDVYIAKAAYYEGVMSLTRCRNGPSTLTSEGWIKIAANSSIKECPQYLYVVTRKEGGQVVPVSPHGSGKTSKFFMKRYPESFKESW